MGALTMAQGGKRKNTKHEKGQWTRTVIKNKAIRCGSYLPVWEHNVTQWLKRDGWARSHVCGIGSKTSASMGKRALAASESSTGWVKSYFHSLLCCDLHDLFHRSSGLVSRPLADLSLSPCIRGRGACRPITLLHQQRVRKPAPRRKRMLILITLRKPKTSFVLCWSTIILLSYLLPFFFFYWDTVPLKRACSTGSPVHKVSIKNTKQINKKFEETEQNHF